MRLARVWPLRPGLTGVLTNGTPVDLLPGRRGFMEYETAVAAQERGDVQLMAGIAPQQLKDPVYETAAVRAQAPEDLDSVPDEIEDPPKPILRKKVAARKRYSRRDMQAEKT